MCVCVKERESVCVCVCVCVREREREYVGGCVFSCARECENASKDLWVGMFLKEEHELLFIMKKKV